MKNLPTLNFSGTQQNGCGPEKLHPCVREVGLQQAGNWRLRMHGGIRPARVRTNSAHSIISQVAAVLSIPAYQLWLAKSSAPFSQLGTDTSPFRGRCRHDICCATNRISAGQVGQGRNAHLRGDHKDVEALVDSPASKSSSRSSRHAKDGSEVAVHPVSKGPSLFRAAWRGSSFVASSDSHWAFLRLEQ